MRVRCTRLVDANNQPVESSRALTVGKEYVVLEISATVGQQVHVRITSDLGTHSLWPIDIFEVTVSTLAAEWVATFEEQQVMLCPVEWARQGFWDDYFNEDRESG